MRAATAPTPKCRSRSIATWKCFSNELSDDVDLSSSLTDFFNAVDEVLKDPGNMATRNLAVGKGIALTENIGNLHSRVFSIQQELNDRVIAVADEINSLAEEIRLLNIQIASTEGGDTSGERSGRIARETARRRSTGFRNWSAFKSKNSPAAA